MVRLFTKMVVITLFASAQLSHSATMLYRQSFETPIENNPEIEWISKGYPLSQAVVTENPKDGNKSIRGNFNNTVVDPITHLKGDPFPHFKIYFKNIPTVKDWYRTTDKFYMSYWFKIDKCFWKGSGFVNTDPLKATAKFAYIRMNEDPATSYYFSMSGGSTGEGVFQVNDDNWMKLWQQWYNISALWNQSGSAYGADGQWHRLSFFIGVQNGQKYVKWWIDDQQMRKDKLEPEGKFKITNDFVMDSIQFWITKQVAVENSEEAGVPGNYCNGWQIDDVQIWDDIPVKPKPPVSK